MVNLVVVSRVYALSHAKYLELKLISDKFGTDHLEYHLDHQILSNLQPLLFLLDIL